MAPTGWVWISSTRKSRSARWRGRGGAIRQPTPSRSLVRSGDHLECEREVVGAQSRRARPPRGHRRPTAAPAVPGKVWPRSRHDAIARLVGEHARNRAPACAASRRCRSPSRAPRSRPPARRPRRPTSRPACGLNIVGIAGGAVDRIGGLPVGERRRRVGLADDHRAGGLEPLDHRRHPRSRPKILEGGDAPGRRQAGDVGARLLHGHRASQQRPPLAARQRLLGRDRRLARAVVVAHRRRR